MTTPTPTVATSTAAAPTNAAKRRGAAHGASRLGGDRSPIGSARGRAPVGIGSAARAGRSACWPRRTMEPWPRTHLRSHRRHPGVGDPRRRRQGQGAEGRGRERHRLRRRRARLPDPRRTSSRPPIAACREPRYHHYSPTPGLPELREAIAHKTKRDSGVDCAAAQVSSPTAASTRSTTRSRCSATRATRCCCPRRTGRRIPRCITLAGGVPVVLPTTGGDRVPGHGRAARSRVHAAHEGAAVRLAEQPDRRGVSARRGRGDRPLGARARHLGRHRRDLRAPHLRRARVLVDARPRARARRPVRDPQRRRQDLRDDGLARRLDDRARRRRPRPRPTCSRTRRRTSRTSRRRPRSRR